MRKFLMLCALLLGFATVARAQDVPPLSWQRVAIVVDGGLSQWDSQTGAVMGKTSDLALLGGISYSAGRMIQFAVSENYLTGQDLGMLELGVRSMIVGDGTGQYSQLGLGVNAVEYHGPGAELLGGQHWSWNAGLYASYNVAGKVNKPLRWYIAGAGIVDPNEKGDLMSKTRYRLSLRAVGIPHLFQ